MATSRRSPASTQTAMTRVARWLPELVAILLPGRRQRSPQAPSTRIDTRPEPTSDDDLESNEEARWETREAHPDLSLITPTPQVGRRRQAEMKPN